MSSHIRTAVTLFVLLSLLPAICIAATYTVTQSIDCGSGTIVDAVAQANANPGHDTINFAPGIKELLFPNCTGFASDVDSADWYLLWITESVDIVAPTDVDPATPGDQKLTLNGNHIWLSVNGYLRPDECPKSSSFTGFLVRQFPGLLRIGIPYVDNSNISVTVRNLKVTLMDSFAIVFKGATLTAFDSDLMQNANIYHCAGSVIRMRDDTTLSLQGVHAKGNRLFAGLAEWLEAVVISTGSNTTIEIDNSIFEFNIEQGAIATSESKLTIVNSLFNQSGGIWAQESDVTIINSAFFGVTDRTVYWEGLWGMGGTFDIRSSTFSSEGWLSSNPPYDMPPGVSNASILRFVGNANVQIDGTAIHGLFPTAQKLPLVYVAPTVQLTVGQSYSGDGSLAGTISGPPYGINTDIPFQPWAITPLQGGPLIDKIDNTANPLINPLTGAPITTDVFGNPRLDGILRDIGAVELQDAPIVIADGIVEAVVLTWSKPDSGSATITGYVIEYRPSGTATWISWPRTETTLLDIVSGLIPGTLYEFRVAAQTNQGQLPWSATVTATPTAQVPTVTTQAVTGIGTTSADGNGNITDLGSPNPTQHGVCWNTTGFPTILASKTEEGGASAAGPFTSNMTGLTPGITYYVRAYATNMGGTSYGNQVSFITSSQAPTVTTQAETALGATTADGNGNITDLGAPNPTQHGVCWNTTGTPTIGDSKTENGAVSATGAFASHMAGLSANTKYYVRAYATNTAGTSYGTQVDFTTRASAATVTTQAVTAKGTTAATGNGNITDLGSSNPTAHGVCWNTAGTPTIGDSFKDEGAVSATGAYTSDMTGLSPNTTYYVRAYVTDANWGTIYGNQVSFTTSAQAPTVTTQAVTAKGATTADGNGNITDLGAPNPTQHGVCWSTSVNPTIAGSKTENGAVSATGAFASHMSGLSPNTTYYVRAYATNTAGTSYGTQVSYITRASAATVTTQAVTGIGTTMATGNGNITDLGAPPPTQHGVCWNTTGTPTIAGSKTEEGPATATGAFTSNMTGLSRNTTYYIRAYVTDAAGTIYGNQVSFTTSLQVPTVTTQKVSGIDKTTAIGNGNITNLGLSNPTQHGVCWNITGTPTTADSKTEEGSASVTGAFTSNITGLRSGTDYYVRAYATNASGTSYGNQVFFISSGRLATGTPFTYKVTVTKVEMYNGTLWVTIFSGAAQLEMVAGGTFPGISELILPAGTYSQVRITFNNAFPVTGTLSHNGTGYYTTVTAFGGQPHLFSTSTTAAGSMSEFEFYEPAWGGLNADVTQTSSITPFTVGPATDYQPTLRFTISTTFHLKESTGNTPSVYFSLGVPPVKLVEP